MRTLDGGRSWQGIPAPPAYLDGYDLCASKEPGQAVSPCIRQLRFATPLIGYAYGLDSFVTRDGGRTWRQEPGPRVDSLAVSGATVIRVAVVPGHDLVQRQSVDNPHGWQTLPLEVGGFVSVLVRDGPQTVYLVPDVATGQMIYRSLDGGDSWVQLASPCGLPAYITDAAATSAGGFTVLCTAYQGAAFIELSTDGGASFRAAPSLLVPDRNSGPAHLAAPNANTLAVADSGDNIVQSTDAGLTWQVVLTLADTGSAPDQAQPDIGLGFQDATVGHVIEPPDAVATSTDGGRHWSPVHVG